MSRIYLNRDWIFSREFKEGMQSFIAETGERVCVPHTVAETAFNYFDESEYQMVSCYQKKLFAKPEWEGKSVLLTFEAVGHYAKVFVNGEYLGDHKNGYTAFTFDLADVLKYGEDNLICVVCDSNETINQPPFGFVIDYMTYGGIYRDVYLEVKDAVHLSNVFYQPRISGGFSTKEIATATLNGTLRTTYTLSQKANELCAGAHLKIVQYLNDKKVFEGPLFTDLLTTTDVGKVLLWDVTSPTRYEVKTELYCDGNLVDTDEATIGFRTMDFKKDGFYLNGRKLKIVGLNRHQSFPYVGYAMPESMQRNDARLLKEELGANAVRTSHYPQSHYFIDECDKLGLLVFTEIPGWQHIGGAEWKDIAVENVREMVEQYRNHPSIMLWGVRINESMDDDEFYIRTNEVAHKCDPTRQTGGVRCIKNSNLFEDVYTYNDFVHSGKNVGCEPKSKVTSNVEKGYLISEYNGHMYPTKTFDDEEQRLEHTLRHANVLNAVAGEADIAGSFAWCMFDYNTHKDFGSGDRICYHGVMDMFRNRKMAAYVYAAENATENVLELSSSMDIGEHPACNRGKTYILSNADSVKMYKNDKLLKEYFPQDSSYKNLKHGPILVDEFVGDEMGKIENYKKGQEKAIRYMMNTVALNGYDMTPGLIWAAIKCVVIYGMKPNQAIEIYNKYVGDWGGASKQYKLEAIKDGKVVKTVIKDAAKSVSMEVDCSHTTLVEGITYDTAAIRLKATDQFGNVLPLFAESVKATVEGPIEIVGPDVIPFRGGLTGLYVKTAGASGDAKLTLSCSLCEPVEISFHVEANDEA